MYGLFLPLRLFFLSINGDDKLLMFVSFFSHPVFFSLFICMPIIWCIWSISVLMFLCFSQIAGPATLDLAIGGFHCFKYPVLCSKFYCSCYCEFCLYGKLCVYMYVCMWRVVFISVYMEEFEMPWAISVCICMSKSKYFRFHSFIDCQKNKRTPVWKLIN